MSRFETRLFHICERSRGRYRGRSGPEFPMYAKTLRLMIFPYGIVLVVWILLDYFHDRTCVIDMVQPHALLGYKGRRYGRVLSREGCRTSGRVRPCACSDTYRPGYAQGASYHKFLLNYSLPLVDIPLCSGMGPFGVSHRSARERNRLDFHFLMEHTDHYV